MLANGTKFGYKKKGSGSYIDISEDLKETPELGGDVEEVDNTGLNDKNKRKEPGISDLGSLEYKFRYDNENQSSVYRVMRAAQDAREVLSFCETLPDGTKFEFDAIPSTKISSGAVNGVLELIVKLSIQSDMNVTDPAEQKKTE